MGPDRASLNPTRDDNVLLPVPHGPGSLYILGDKQTTGLVADAPVQGKYLGVE